MEEEFSNSKIGSASGSFQNHNFLGGDFGFPYYQRHVFLCYNNPNKVIEDVDALPSLLSASVAAADGDMKRKTRLTICEGHDGTDTSNGDVLIFPDMIRYRRLTHFDVDTFVEEVLVKDSEWLPGTPEALRGSYIFVSSHVAGDDVSGPAVVTRFKEEIESHGLQGKVYVQPCSHIGGHNYAGNVIIFGSTISREVTGHWYGYVMPDDVPTLLEQHIEKGEVVHWLWRGEMGLPEEDQKIYQELRLQLSDDINMERSINNAAETIEISTSACQSQVKGNGYCQTDNISTSTSCQNPLLPEIADVAEPNAEANSIAARRSKKQTSRNNNVQGAYTRKVCAMPTWVESWEREDTYAALAITGAAVSVMVAYNCYKQLR